MAMNPDLAFKKALAVSKTYTDETVVGGGAIKGKNCTVKSITDITGGHRVTFEWTLDNGTVKTNTMDVMNGVDGQDGQDGQDGKDGKGIKSVTINEEEHLIITYTDDTTTDAGKIEVQSAVDSVNGKTGVVVLGASDVGALPDNTPIPSKTSDLTNDSGFITKAVNDLVSYYLKSETYTKTEVDDIVTAVKNSRFEVVATLPTTDIKTNVIYLVPKSPSQTSNVKDEYINLDGTTAGWEKIGDTEIDLSDYVTTQALNTALAAYTTTADLTTLLAAKQDTLTFDNAPTENSNNPVKSNGIYAANQNIYEVMGQNGAKNLIPFDIDAMKVVNVGGTWSGNEYTYNGITFAVNSDGTITVSGIASALTRLAVTTAQFENGKAYTMTGCPEGGNHVDTYTLYTQTVQNYDDGEGVTFNWNSSITSIAIAIFSGVDLTTPITFKPMLRLASDTDSTYQSYVKTNKQLTDDAEALTSQANDMVNVLGAKNVLPFPYYAGSGTYNGVTITDNGDGSITLDGTCTGMSFFVFYGGRYSLAPTTFVKKNEDYIATLEVVSGSMAINSGTSRFVFRNYITNATSPFVDIFYEENVIDTRSVKFTYEPTASYDTSLVWYEFNVGTTFNNWRIRPMIRLASIQDDTYEPYAKTNQELTSNVTAIDNARIMYGVENILPNTLESGVAATSVKYTRNSDGTVSVSGSAVGNAILPIGKITGLTKVRLTGCPSGGGGSAYQIQPKDLTDNSYPFVGDYGEGKNYTLDSTHVYRMDIIIREGYSISGTKLFKPMVVDLSAYSGTTYDDYVPYAKSNRELTEDTASAIVNVPNGAINLAKPNSAGTTTVSNVEFVIDSEGKVTANGTASANIRFDMAEVTLKAGRTYKICEPSSLQARRPFNPETYRCYARIKSSGVWVLQNNGWKGSYTPTEDVVVSVGIAMQSGNEVTDEIFAPMIVLVGTDVGDTFYPYAMTNRELTANAWIGKPRSAWLNLGNKTTLTITVPITPYGGSYMQGLIKLFGFNNSTLIDCSFAFTLSRDNDSVTASKLSNYGDSAVTLGSITADGTNATITLNNLTTYVNLMLFYGTSMHNSYVSNTNMPEWTFS